MAHTLNDHPLVFLDVETTGASTAYGDRVTEVALLRIERGCVVDRYAQLFNPGRPIPHYIASLTGIDDDLVADQPAFAEASAMIVEKLAGSVVIGHNIRFDLGFMDAELSRCGHSLASVIQVPNVLDTVRIARRLYGRGGNGLQKLAARLEIHVESAHRALADCATTAEVFSRMLEPLGGVRMKLTDVIALQGGPCRFKASANPLA